MRPSSKSAISGLKPGNTLRGFKILSPLLPTVRDAKAVGEGRGGGDSSYDGQPESVERALSRYVGSNDDCVSGQVVGPGAASVTIEALQGYLKASVENGWLEDGILQEQVAALIDGVVDAETAKKRELVLTGLRELRDLVDSAYNQKNASILSEAHALFYFNAEYLMVQYKKE